MASYYYLMSSLPMIRAEGEMPFSYDRFLEICRPCVSDARYTLLKELTVSSDKGPLLAEWSEYYKVFRRELTALRVLRQGRQTQSTAVRDETISKAINAAIGGKNPLEAEKALLSLSFEKVDELIGMHYFDDYALMGYALKLRLLERKSVFDQKKGRAEFERILKKLQKQIMVDEQE